MNEYSATGFVISVSSSPRHTMSKPTQLQIRLVEGYGVEGDACNGTTVKHRSRVRQDPTQPNLCQVHLIHSELHEEPGRSGFEVAPGQMGENIATSGIDLLALSEGTVLRIGEDGVLKVTGLRNPCSQLEGVQHGLMGAVLHHDKNGELVPRSGIMAVVVTSGGVRPGDKIVADPVSAQFKPLMPV